MAHCLALKVDFFYKLLAKTFDTVANDHTVDIGKCYEIETKRNFGDTLLGA